MSMDGNDAEMKGETEEMATENNGQVQIGPVAPGGPDGDSFSRGGNEDRKIFVGGISYETTQEDLTQYFSQFGQVTQAQVKYDQITGRSRGFAFVEFAASDPCVEVLKQKNREIKGKTVEVKPAKSRENKKIFVGGLPAEFPEEELKSHFEQFGKVDDVEWPWDKSRGIRRNFAFVVFEEETAADSASEQAKQRFGDRMCDVKKAVPQPKRQMMGMGAGGAGGRGGAGGGRGRGRGGYGGSAGGQWGGGAGAYGGWGGGNYGGWGDWYGSAAGGYGNYYGSGYGGGYYDAYYNDSDYYNNYNWNAAGGWGQTPQAAAGAPAVAAPSYDSFGQSAGGAGGAGQQSQRGGRYQPY